MSIACKPRILGLRVTIRFSPSQVDPLAYFTRKRQQEAKERGEFIDIHDIGGTDPGDFDVLISDVDDEKLRGEVTEIVGIPYHAEATKEDAIGKTSDLFDISEESGPDLINIAGHQVPVYRSPTHSQFTELNLLGMDFFHYYNVSQANDFKKRRAKLYFGQKWKMVEDD
ncbi:uncharacterized protein H6S33_010397 [Morchella sextelata]|uniref:uncharacterized protein n=1 Tax=Morchella sextelata TaxID=1174677 RepID=UPI001D055F37|nr:uncharacterized protein H6S33_010397 [Morchella sextelata]KAH0612345.1 hypothetical protein H6S33_010397 [Morchella sextelata]